MSQLKTQALENNAVTNAKSAQMATLTIKGNNTGGTANSLDLTVAQVKTMLSLTGTNSGDVTLGTFGTSPSVSGSSLSGQILTLQPADGTNPGGVSTTTQTFAGNKTFTGSITASNLSGTNSGDVTLTAIGASPTGNGASLSGQALTLQPANGSFGGVVTATTQTFAGNKTFTGTVAALGLSASDQSFIVGSQNTVQFYVKGFSTQSVDIFQLIKSDNTALLTVGNAGNVVAAGSLSSGVAGGSAGSLKLLGSTSGTATIVAPAAVTSYSVTWPTAQAVGTQVLQNNGSGVLSWQDASSGGTVTTVSVASANGFAGSVANATTTPAITLTTTVTGVLKGNGTAISAATSGTDYSAGTSGLATGILKSTTTTGALTIAVAGDFPTLNQNTTGTASNVTGVVAIANGGTGQSTKAAGFDALSPMTSTGDIIYGGSSGTGTRLAAGTDGQFLTLASGIPSWASVSVAKFAPRINTYTSGSGNHDAQYIFTVTSASATSGATYTNNSVTFTVVATVASGTTLFASGNGTPTASGTLTKASGTGDATITFSSVAAPVYLRVSASGGGGGGGGGATQAAANGGTGGTGGTTTFGSVVSCAGGVGGAYDGNFTAGGTATISSPAYGSSWAGGRGGPANRIGLTAGFYGQGGGGGSNHLGGGGPGGGDAFAGVDGQTNTGGGGGGGSTSTGAASATGAGGAAGAYVQVIIPSPATQYAYGVGTAGTSGGAGTAGLAGGVGGTGIIVVESCYQ